MPPEIGALSQWRRELARGQRTKLKLDPLALAAICEANARDEIAAGIPNVARQSRLDAAKLIVDAVAQNAA